MCFSLSLPPSPPFKSLNLSWSLAFSDNPGVIKGFINQPKAKTTLRANCRLKNDRAISHIWFIWLDVCVVQQYLLWLLVMFDITTFIDLEFIEVYEACWPLTSLLFPHSLSPPCFWNSAAAGRSNTCCQMKHLIGWIVTCGATAETQEAAQVKMYQRKCKKHSAGWEQSDHQNDTIGKKGMNWMALGPRFRQWSLNLWPRL